MADTQLNLFITSIVLFLMYQKMKLKKVEGLSVLDTPEKKQSDSQTILSTLKQSQSDNDTFIDFLIKLRQNGVTRKISISQFVDFITKLSEKGTDENFSEYIRSKL